MSNIQQFDFSVDVMRSLLWEHNMDDAFISLMQQEQDWYTENQTEFWTNWFRDVFDLRTANTFGLKVWSIILGIPLSIASGNKPFRPAFGFGPFNRNFYQSNFGDSASTAIVLTPAQARLVLQLRYYKLISKCTVPDINRFLSIAFKDYGQAWVLDGNDMSFVTYVFTFVPDSMMTFLIQEYDLLPRPAGVGVKITIVPSTPFGFDNNENFDQAAFAEGS